MIQAAKIIGTGMATIGLIGAGVGIGVVFVASIVGVEEFPNDIRYYLANIMIIVTWMLITNIRNSYLAKKSPIAYKYKNPWTIELIWTVACEFIYIYISYISSI